MIRTLPKNANTIKKRKANIQCSGVRFFLSTVSAMFIMQKKFLEKIYKKYNRRKYVSPDPLEFLYNYKKDQDIEIIGLVAASLAYGRVAQILKSVNSILEKLSPLPKEFLVKEKKLNLLFKGFRHRFTTGKDISSLLEGVKKAVIKHGSLQNCFLNGYSENDGTIIPALSNFVKEVKGRGKDAYLLPSPEKGSACKRLNLYLRWMVRKDNVDPGGWKKVPKSKLIVPLDTHLFNIAGIFGFSNRKQANLKSALEITNAFKQFCPRDPVKYDFALTRFGIRNDMGIEDIVKDCSDGVMNSNTPRVR